MKVLILAGGYGTRLSEETELKPKPMVHIGEYPMLWHIMKIYAAYGYNEFIILLGYKGNMIKDYFLNYFMHHNDFTIDLANNQVQHHTKRTEDWKITFLDTGNDTMTGGRVKQAAPYIQGERFMLTYGDGVADIDIQALVDFHEEKQKLCTMTSIIPEGRFGRLQIDEEQHINSFVEKPREENWINGGFFVCEPEVLDYIEGDDTVLEKKPLETLAQNDQLVAYKHRGFWRCMDTIMDKRKLEEIWQKEGKWKVWH